MKANEDQCIFKLVPTKSQATVLTITLLKKSKYERLRCVKIDQNLNFNAHINGIV